MDKRFHLFVRKLAAGVAVAPITLPYLGAFGPDVESARRDLAFVLRRLLAHGELHDERGFFADARLRRLPLVLRCLQGRRLLEVPMKFSVLTFSSADDTEDAAPGRGRTGPLRVLVPRLGLDGQIENPGDLDAYLEEIIRHALHLAPLDRLMEVAYAGEESLETMIVPVPPSSVRPPRPRPTRAAVLTLPPALGEACRRLDLPGREDALERAYQREEEVARLEQHLGSRVRASVLLVGPVGVGKTCLVHELAARALGRSGKERLELYTTNASRIVAGMRYLGEWQERLRRMVAELRERRAVLHFESLAELQARRGRGDDSVDLIRFLLPAVEAGDVTLIVEATAEDAARAERMHGAFVQALRPLVLAPLGAVAARQALAQVALRLGRARGVRFADAALDRALDLAERFDEGCLPGAAVSLLRAAAPARSRPRSAASVTVLDEGEVLQAFCARTGYPRSLVDARLPLDPAAVHAQFRGRVLGQEHATERLAQLVVTLKTNLTDPRKPLGSFLLLGPTGVGKTESALALTAFLFGDEGRLRRFDMAEYAAPGSARRLLADDRQGLVRRTREEAFGVLLLDEIEKADAGVLDLLLQLLGDGRLSDERGQVVSFRNSIVVLTSNLGADTSGRSLGFGAGSEEAQDTHYRAAAAAFFRPELLNRFDQIIAYRPLGRDVVKQIARQVLTAALTREGLQRRGTSVVFDEEVVDALTAAGFDPLLGARPLKRAVERLVVAPLADLLGRSPRAPSRLRLRRREDGDIEIVADASG